LGGIYIDIVNTSTSFSRIACHGQSKSLGEMAAWCDHSMSFCIYIYFTWFHSLSPFFEFHCINAFFVSQTPCVVAWSSAHYPCFSTDRVLEVGEKRSRPEAAVYPTRNPQPFPCKIGIFF